MSRSFITLSAIIAIAAAAPAFATAAAPATRAAPPAATPQGTNAAAQTPTRTGIIRGVEARFKAIDANGDGTLSQAELASAEAKGLQQQLATIRGKMDAEFNKLDTNHDGQLSKTEYMAASPQLPATMPNGSDVLAQLDKNHDGKVTLDEYREPAITRFDKLDTNHDGVLSATELQAARAQQAAAAKH